MKRWSINIYTLSFVSAPFIRINKVSWVVASQWMTTQPSRRTSSRWQKGTNGAGMLWHCDVVAQLLLKGKSLQCLCFCICHCLCMSGWCISMGCISPAALRPSYFLPDLFQVVFRSWYCLSFVTHPLMHCLASRLSIVRSRSGLATFCRPWTWTLGLVQVWSRSGLVHKYCTVIIFKKIICH